MGNIVWAVLAGLCGLWASGCGGGPGGSGEGGGGAAGGGSGAAGGGTSAGGTTATATSTVTGELCDEADHAGKVTYYNEADGSGNCSFDPIAGDLMVAAMNTTDYDMAAACGACARIEGSDGKSVVVRIVDRCPGCEQGHVDLSPDAFALLAELSVGVMPVTWRYASCDYQGPIQYKFKEGSNAFWTAVQIRHHSNRIARLEYDKGGEWVEVARVEYNYFVEAAGMGEGPYRFRVTDVLGQTLEDEGIVFAEGGVVDGKGQFPSCAGQ